MLPQVTATRYVTPLREGGSLPGLMEADDLGTYVVKFRGAGQGPATLVAEVICASLAAALGLDVPRLVTVVLDPALAPGEPDQEVQDLLRASEGLNLGVDFLPGALDLDRPTGFVDPGWAARVLWFDAYAGNVDRSWRNPNMLSWHRRPYLIDHGATLTFHHSWPIATGWPRRPYDAAEHALVAAAAPVQFVDAGLAAAITDDVLGAAVDEVPDSWLAGWLSEVWEGQGAGFDDLAAVRARYVELLSARRDDRERWLASAAGLTRKAAS